MSKLAEGYRSLLRPTRKVTDIFPLAFLITFILISLGTLIGEILLRLVGFPPMPSDEMFELINQGRVTVEEAVGAPAYLAFASMYLSFSGIWIVFALIMALFPANRRMLKKLVFVHDRNSLALTGLGLLMGFGINTACVLLSAALGNIRLHFAHFEIGPFLLLLFAVFVQSGAEEISCRLYLYQKLARRYRHPAIAISLSAIYFAALHGFNPGITAVAFAQIVAIGILFSVLVYYYDALGACVAMHTAWNFAQSILYGLPNSGAVSLYSVFKLDAASSGVFFDPVFGVEGSIGAVALITLACVGLVVYAKKHDLRPKDLWTDEEEEARHTAC